MTLADYIGATESKQLGVSKTLRPRSLVSGDSGPYAERPIAPGLPEAAAKLSQLGKQCSRLNLSLFTRKSPEINKIRAVLGAEDNVEKTPVSIGGHDIFIHRYGWIQFLVMNNQVTRVVFDFKNSGY
jgi:hypothetical protein